MLEIERKFILGEKCKEELSRLVKLRELEIVQFYTVVEPEKEVRFRKVKHQETVLCFETVKEGFGLTRKENEKSVSEELFRFNLDNAVGRVISKTRKVFQLGEYEIEVDFYKNNDLVGLVVAEVEFNSEEAADNFIPPISFGMEVTEDKRFKNKNLAIASDNEIFNLLNSIVQK